MSRFWFQPPQTEVAQRISDLHITLLWIVAAIGVIVFGLMIYSLWRHRKSVGAVPAQFEGRRKFEIIWTIIPIVIVVAGKENTRMCVGCHGIADYRIAYPEVYAVPRIGGQDAGYIAKSLEAYRASTRKHVAMLQTKY